MNTSRNFLEAVVAVVNRSASDEDFRARALSDPEAPVREIGGELPSGVRLRFAEDTEELVIPLVRPPATSGEISDDSLEAVSGGHVNWTFGDILGLNK
jgi:hypothetical protein